MTKIQGSAIRITAAALILAYTAYLLLFGGEAKDSASRGLSLCVNVILTTVFPFSVASALLLSSGICESLGKSVGRPLAKLFGISYCGSGVVLLGLIGGYPSGAYAAYEYCRSGAIGRDEADRLASYTDNATPAFMTGYIGSLLGSVKAGAFLYAVNIASSFLWAIMLRTGTVKKAAVPISKPAVSFTGSVTSSAVSAVYACAFVIVFSVISGAVSHMPGRYFPVILTSLLEVTTGASAIFSACFDPRLSAACLSACTSFSGLCVASQAFSAAHSEKRGVILYISGKLFQAFVSFFTVYLLYPIILY